MSGQLVLNLVLIGLGAAVSPVALIVLISLMMRKYPRRNSLLFFLGYTLTLLVIGLVVVSLLPLSGSGRKSAIDGYIDLSLGILCLVAIPLTHGRKKKQKESRHGGDLKPAKAFSLGILTMIPNSSTLIIFISGLHTISAAHLNIFNDVLALVLLTLITLVTLIIPLAWFLLFPGKAEKVLVSLSDWLSKHKRLIGVTLLLVFGIYLVIKGLSIII